MALTKAHLIEKVTVDVGLNKKIAMDIIEKLFEVLKGCLQNAEDLKISGFGTFHVRDKKTRMGRNPQTGEAMEISARRVVTFKPSQRLRDALNGKQ
jgi:integration host factor subunit alpha